MKLEGRITDGGGGVTWGMGANLLPTRLGVEGGVGGSGRVLCLPRWEWLDATDLRTGRGVCVEKGRVVSVGSAEKLRRGFEGEVVEMPGALVTGGLVNWHCHLELSGVTPPPPPPPPASGGRGFVDWLGEVMARGPKSGAEAAEAARAGVEQCRRFGVTKVLDITRNPREVRRALAGMDVEVVSFAEVTGMAKRRGRAKGMIEAGCDVKEFENAANLSFGLSPHAPYSTEMGVYRACAEACERLGWGMMTHLAEVEEEWEFVERQTGVFRELWDRLGDWSEDVERVDGGWTRWMGEAGFGRCDVVAAHMNHVTDWDEVVLEAFGFSGVHCPRTHRYFGRGRFDVGSKSGSIMNWRLGTDSLASCPDLNLMEEMREVARAFPGMSPGMIFGMGSGWMGVGEAAIAWEVGEAEDPLGLVLGRE